MSEAETEKGKRRRRLRGRSSSPKNLAKKVDEGADAKIGRMLDASLRIEKLLAEIKSGNQDSPDSKPD
jgi:hypothetical protein